jgi:hypothetical protein
LDTAFTLALSFPIRSNTFFDYTAAASDYKHMQILFVMSAKSSAVVSCKNLSHTSFQGHLEKTLTYMIQKIGTMAILLNIISMHCFFVACQPILQSGSLSGTCVTTYSGNQMLAIPHLKENYCHRKWRLFTCDTETPTLTSYQT